MQDLPFFQVEAGTRMNEGMVIDRLKYGAFLTDPERCLLNELEETCDTNAWFCCAFPVELINGDQLPLPLFYQFDDVEFGLRHRGKLIHLNGICVWHEAFERKLYNNRYYYSQRNQLIVAAVHGIQPNAKTYLKIFRNNLLREILCLRYKTADMMLDGIDDFLKGIDWLKSLDTVSKNNEISDKCYRLADPNETGINISWDSLESSVRLDDKSKISRMLRLLTFNGLFMKPNKVALVNTTNARPIHFYRAAVGVYYDLYTHKVFTTNRSRKDALTLFKRYLHIKNIFKKKYVEVCNEYLRRRGELISVGFWEKQFGIK